jgi:hypothetical protein
MNENKLFSWKFIIGLSLLISETFYFTLRIGKMLKDDMGHSYIALNKFAVSEIIISTVVLFIFSICVISLILIINNTEKNKFPFSILILLTTFLLAISFKLLFDIADFSWHHVGWKFIYSDIKNRKIILFLRLFWFLAPFIASLILVILLKKNIHKILNFLSIFGFVLFALMSYQVLTLQKLHSSFNKKDIYHNNHSALKKNRKVIWIIFDEFDHEIAFSRNEHNFKLPNLTKLKNNSVTHNKMFAPALNTFFSLPSILIGEYVSGAKFKNHRYIMISKDKKEFPFTIENTIFGKINNDGFTSSITGVGFHSYCLMIQVKCKVFNQPLKWFDGILHILHEKHINAFILRKGPHRDISPMIVKSMYDFIEAPNPTNFLFIHNKIPHTCHNCKDGLAKMAEDHFNTKANKDTEAYLLNIRFTDYLIGEILKKINTKNYKEGETLLILNSDHGARPDAVGTFESRKKDPPQTPYPALFIAKILGDNQKLEIFDPDSSIHVQELVHQFLKKEISTHLDIEKFFKEKSGYDVFIPSDKDPTFIVEKNF